MRTTDEQALLDASKELNEAIEWHVKCDSELMAARARLEEARGLIEEAQNRTRKAQNALHDASRRLRASR